MQNKLVTVYITNHNYGKYINQSIDSVLKQSYSDIELIIIDDGSNDNSRKIINNYRNRSNIKIIYQNKKGLTISNNIALKQAKGYFFLRLDADDYLDKNAIKILVNEFDNEQIGMVFGDWYVVNDQNEVIGIEKRHDFQNEVTLYDQPAHGACTMFRTEYIKNIGGYDETLKMQDGYELWFRFIKKYKIKNINVPIFYYRKHGKSLSDKTNKLIKTRSTIYNQLSKKNNIKSSSSIAIFPIRGEKLDYRSKPFWKLNGKFLIDWSIEAFKKANTVDKIIICTPDKNIINYIKKNYNTTDVISLRRPLNISYIGVNIIDTIDFIDTKLDIINNYDSFFLHSIEAPFIEYHLIESALNILKIFDTDTVVSVKEENRHIFKHSGKGMKPVNYSEGIIRYEREKWYVNVTGFLLRNMSDFRKTKRLIGSKVGHVLFDKKSSLVIEDMHDLEFAKSFL